MENVYAGYVLRCVQDCPYAKIGDIKNVTEKTEAFYTALVNNKYFEVISKGESHATKSFKQAFAVGFDKMPEDFKTALMKGC